MNYAQDAESAPSTESRPPVQEVVEEMNHYESRAEKLTKMAAFNLGVGALATGGTALVAAKSESIGVGFDGFVAAANYVCGALGLSYATSHRRNAAVLRGVLAQHQITTGSKK